MDYMNEWDRDAAAWLRELIRAGHIPSAHVDERSVRDVRPSDLASYRQCHFFSGIGGWCEALRLAGWNPARPVWTASLPCQPFSSAGKGRGEEDERHLWPVFLPIVRECRPPTIFGEQVASRAGYEWIDGVRASLEAEGYAFGAADLPACSQGAPHIRSRLFWVAVTASPRQQKDAYRGEGDSERFGPDRQDDGARFLNGPVRRRKAGRVDDTERSGHEHRQGVHAGLRRHREAKANIVGPDTDGLFASCTVGVAHPDGAGCEQHGRQEPAGEEQTAAERGSLAGDPSGFWDAYDVLPFTDGKFRRVEPGSFPLADGIPGRVAMLRGYGNAISPQCAAAFVRAFIETGY